MQALTLLALGLQWAAWFEVCRDLQFHADQTEYATIGAGALRCSYTVEGRRFLISVPTYPSLLAAALLLLGMALAGTAARRVRRRP